jgi:hypothetical protein
VVIFQSREMLMSFAQGLGRFATDVAFERLPAQRGN